MRILRFICLAFAWTGLSVFSLAHYVLVAFTKGMGMILAFENVTDMQPWFAVLSIFVAGLFWSGGWQPWRAAAVAAGAQAMVFAVAIFTFRSEYEQSHLEWIAAIISLIAGAAAVYAAVGNKPLLLDRIKTD